jgi:hypothetical protein
MANPQILRSAIVEMQGSLDTSKTLTGVSNASEGVFTGTHDFAIGDLIVIGAPVGMPTLGNQVVRVKSVNTTVDFTAEGFDTTNSGTYVSGGTAEKVLTFLAFDNVTNLSLPDDPPEELDVTTIHDSEKQNVFGLEAASKGTFSTIADPLSTTSVEIGVSRAANTRRVFRVTLQSGYVGIFNAFVSGGRGIDGGAGAAATGTVSLTLRSPAQWFAS